MCKCLFLVHLHVATVHMYMLHDENDLITNVFFGVGTMHPSVSLLLEVGDLPVVWLVRLHIVAMYHIH